MISQSLLEVAVVVAAVVAAVVVAVAVPVVVVAAAVPAVVVAAGVRTQGLGVTCADRVAEAAAAEARAQAEVVEGTALLAAQGPRVLGAKMVSPHISAPVAGPSTMVGSMTAGSADTVMGRWEDTEVMEAEQAALGAVADRAGVIVAPQELAGMAGARSSWRPGG